MYPIVFNYGRAWESDLPSENTAETGAQYKSPGLTASNGHMLINSRKEQCSTIFKVVGVGGSAVMFLLLLRALARSPTFRHLGINKLDPFPASANLCWNWNCLCQFSVSRPRHEPIIVNLFSYFGRAYQFQFLRPKVGGLVTNIFWKYQRWIFGWKLLERDIKTFYPHSTA